MRYAMYWSVRVSEGENRKEQPGQGRRKGAKEDGKVFVFQSCRTCSEAPTSKHRVGVLLDGEPWTVAPVTPMKLCATARLRYKSHTLEVSGFIKAVLMGDLSESG